MEKILLGIFIFLVASFQTAYAAEKHADSSAALKTSFTEKKPDVRVKILKEYLETYNSPLSSRADVFVKTADKYNLDWKLVAAISGVESTFGHQIPYNSYNGWGWGIYGTNMIRFSSWDEGIQTVSSNLREKYIDKWGAKDVYEIGRYYASSPTWASKVTYFMDRINKFKDQKLATNLSISL